MFFLKWLWKKWLPIAHAIGNFQAQVILTFFYGVILLPLGIIYRLFADPLRVRAKLRSNFESWQHPTETLESAHKQF